MNSRKGWTLLEMMISLVILAALMAITLPALRSVLSRSQTMQNMSSMRQTMQDFTIWSNSHKGRMVNAGLPQDRSGEHWFYGSPGSPSSLETRIAVYPSTTTSWPWILFNEFGHASHHWQSTYRNPMQWLGDGNETTENLARARRLDPEWEWYMPSDFVYSFTMLTKPEIWKYPGLGYHDTSEIARWYAYVNISDISQPSSKGILLHAYAEAGPGDQRLVAFADGSASQRDLLKAHPAAVSPLAVDTKKRGKPVLSTERGFEGTDW